MAVAFKSQVAVAYKSTATIEWYGDTVIGYIKRYFVKAIDFSFEANTVDYTQGVNKLARDFEVLLEEFEFAAKAIDFTFEVKDVDYTQDANKIDHSEGLI